MMFNTIEPALLATACGGQMYQRPPMNDDPGPRTWGQVGREYVAACVQGAAQSMMFSGVPRNKRQAAGTAALGCAMGVGMKAVDDVSNAITR